MARENGVEGICYVSFVVGVDGKLGEIKLLRDIGAGCGREALRVIAKMAKEKTWIPGKQRGKPVKVRFNLPISYKLR